MNFNDKWFNNQKYITHYEPDYERHTTNRKVSSINFLLNIPMVNESKIKEAGIANANRIKAMDDNDDEPNVEIEHDDTEVAEDEHKSVIEDTPRRASEDFGVAIVRGASDTVEEKEKVVKDYFIDDPKGQEVFKVPIRDWRGCSYKPLFKPLAMMTEEKVQQRASSTASSNPNNAFVQQNMEVFSSEYLEKGFLYDPDLLDDPIMLEDTDRFVSENAPIISSILLYVNENELKDSLNDQFRERHPNLPISLTLSRIRALKKRILIFCISIGYEVSTVAYAMVNFERLCLKNRVTKANRKLSMAVSLLLAIKFVEYESLEGESKKKLDALFNFFDREWDLDKQEILDAEFGAYVILGFNLHVPYQHIYLIYMRLLKIVNKENVTYLGEVMLDAYNADILQIERFRELNRLNLQLEREAGEDGEGHVHKSRHDSLADTNDEKSDNEGGGGTSSAVKNTFNRNFFDLMIQISSAPSPNLRQRMSLDSARDPHSTPSTPTSSERRPEAMTRSSSTDHHVVKSSRRRRSRSSSKSGKKETFVQKLLNIPASLLGLSSTPNVTSSSPTFEQEDDHEHNQIGKSLGKAFADADVNEDKDLEDVLSATNEDAVKILSTESVESIAGFPVV